MDKNRLWVVGAVIVAVAIVAGGWFLGVQPQLAATAAAELERVQSDAQNATHQAELDKLKSDYADLDRLKSQLAALQTSIPEGSELPSFVDQLNALCGTSGVSFVGYTTAASQPYKAASPASGSSGAAPSTPASTSTPAPTAAPAPTPAPTTAPAAGAPPVTNALVTADNFVATPLTVKVQGTYEHILAFVKGLQTGSRLFLVTNIIAAPSSDGSPAGTFDATVTGLIYSMVETPPTAAPGPSSTTDGGTTASK